MKYLDVLCIDGIVGVGKTAQVIIFRNFLKTLNIPHKIVSLKEVDDTEYTRKQLKSIVDYLEQEPEGIVICDGSVAADIVDDIAKNMHHKELHKKHKDNLQIYEELNNKYNFVNILLTPQNLDMCRSRLEKKANMSGKEKKEIKNEEHLRVVSKGLREFNNNMLTYNIKFENIDLNGSENITDIHRKILEIINKEHVIKKPSK